MEEPLTEQDIFKHRYQSDYKAGIKIYSYQRVVEVEKVQSAKRLYKENNCEKVYFLFDSESELPEYLVCEYWYNQLQREEECKLKVGKCDECRKIDACFQIDEVKKNE